MVKKNFFFIFFIFIPLFFLKGNDPEKKDDLELKEVTIDVESLEKIQNKKIEVLKDQLFPSDPALRLIIEPYFRKNMEEFSMGTKQVNLTIDGESSIEDIRKILITSMSQALKDQCYQTEKAKHKAQARVTKKTTTIISCVTGLVTTLITSCVVLIIHFSS